MTQSWAAECRMPLCYGGGIQSVEQAKTIIGLGVEKIALSAAAVARPGLVAEIAAEVGRQSVVVVLDARRKAGDSYEVCTHNATRATGLCPVALARQMEQQGAGEIVVNAVDADGTMAGYDVMLAARIREAVSLPLTILGGAGSTQHIAGLFSRFGVIGAAAGSLFVFKGIYRAVLINYPGPAVRDGLLQSTKR
jgi:cyclase